jgi:pyruvate,water dikinase
MRVMKISSTRTSIRRPFQTSICRRGRHDVILAKAFAGRFDGFSIGSNDLAQFTLGIDRGSEEPADLFDEQDDAVKWMIERVIREAHKAGTKVGLCGQAPSDHPDLAEFLVACGIDSMSVSPDSFIALKQWVAETIDAMRALTGREKSASRLLPRPMRR